MRHLFLFEKVFLLFFCFSAVSMPCFSRVSLDLLKPATPTVLPPCTAPSSLLFTQVAPTCTGYAPLNNGTITLVSATDATKWGISSLNAATYDGPNFVAATAYAANTVVKTGVPNTGGIYIVRVFNSDNTCYTDQIVSVTEVCCSAFYPICPSESYNIAAAAGLTNYQWFQNGVGIPGATNQLYTVADTGTYTYTALDAVGCMFTQCCPVVFYKGDCCSNFAITVGTSPETCGFLLDGSVSITPSGGVPTYIYAWSNAATSASLSSISDGIYSVTVTDANLCTLTALVVVAPKPCDFGDLPDATAGTGASDYQTLLANAGPYHIVTNSLRLGLGIDGEQNGQPNANSDGDGDDEDGFPIGSNINWVTGASINLPFDALNSTGSPAYLEGWIDWNADGDFNDANETIANETIASNANVFLGSITITVPISAAQNQHMGIRFRLSNTDGLTPTGAAATGEVEDYFISVACPVATCLPLTVTRNN